MLGQKRHFAQKIDFFGYFGKTSAFLLFPHNQSVLQFKNCMILVSYQRSWSLWLFDIKNNVVLGYFILIFGQKPFFIVVKFTFLVKKNKCLQSFFTIVALYYMILVSYWRLSFLSLSVVRVLKLQNVYNPLLSYSRPVVSKEQTGVTINLSKGYTLKNNRNFTDSINSNYDKKSMGNREFTGKCPYIVIY